MFTIYIYVCIYVKCVKDEGKKFVGSVTDLLERLLDYR